MNYTEVSILDIIRLCGVWVKHNSNGSELRARCPFCGGQRNKPTASINIDKHLFYCHRCHESHNAVTLYSKLTGAGTKQAYRELIALSDAA